MGCANAVEDSSSKAAQNPSAPRISLDDHTLHWPDLGYCVRNVPSGWSISHYECRTGKTSENTRGQLQSVVTLSKKQPPAQLKPVSTVGKHVSEPARIHIYKREMNPILGEFPLGAGVESLQEDFLFSEAVRFARSDSFAAALMRFTPLEAVVPTEYCMWQREGMSVDEAVGEFVCVQRTCIQEGDCGFGYSLQGQQNPLRSWMSVVVLVELPVCGMNSTIGAEALGICDRIQITNTGAHRADLFTPVD